MFEKPKKINLVNKYKEPKRTKFCQWYKRRKALKLEAKQKEAERIQKARRDRENEFIEQMKLQAKYEKPKPYYVEKNVTPNNYNVEKKHILYKNIQPYVYEKKPRRVKTRTAYAKPKATSKSVSVKRYERYNTLNYRFKNFCYRICCQFYCYLTCIIIIGFLIIYYL